MQKLRAVQKSALGYPEAVLLHQEAMQGGFMI